MKRGEGRNVEKRKRWRGWLVSMNKLNCLD
jgi:hypothetical protein